MALIERVETLKAYRDTLRRRFDQAAHAALEKVPGAEWDGMEVLRRKELERVIEDFAKAEPDPVAEVAEVRTPGTVFVDAICPRCDLPTRILVRLDTELITTLSGSEIKVTAKAKKSAHKCHQLPLEVEDSDQMSLADLTGPTEPVLILSRDVPRPDDVSLETPEEDRCGASAEIDNPDLEPSREVLTCERRIDHDQLITDGARDHWAEGGFGWHYEERPVTLSPDAPDEERIDSEEGEEPE